MPRKIVQIISMPPNHIIALDSEGAIYWRAWNKKGWGLMEQVPLPQDSPTTAPTPSATVPTPAPTSQTSASASGVPQPTPAVIPPVVVPHPMSNPDPA